MATNDAADAPGVDVQAALDRVFADAKRSVLLYLFGVIVMAWAVGFQQGSNPGAGLTVHAVVFALGLSFFAFQLYVQVAYVSSHVKKHLVDSVEAAVLDSVRRQPPSVPQSPARNPDGNGARAKAE